jgi:hypothetical protein
VADRYPTRRTGGYDAFARLDALHARTAGKGATPEESAEVTEMRANRRVNRKLAAAQSAGPSGGAAAVSFATGRPRDPLFYWKQNNLPFDWEDNTQLSRIREFTRLLYMSDSLVGSCVDIYTEYPLLGMELTCKNDDLTQFYTDLFFDEEGLNYEEFLAELGREYWLVGEAWPFGSFNEMLGVWEDEELLNPDDVEVEQSPFLKEPRYLIRLPHTLRDILQSRSPAYEYQKLVSAYPELLRYQSGDDLMPVSNILLRRLRFKGHTFSKRGVPLLMRAMRPLLQQEMLNAAMDAIADRLYVPLVLTKIGASATDLGTTQPWIPTPDQLADFEEGVDTALAADFRILTTHFAVSMEPVFGREQMPDLTPDFERIEDRILQTFGLSKTMLTGASSGETYAADALNRDLISQLLTRYQKMLARHYRQRALVVAEAQGHYDYEERNGKKYVKMEEIFEVDDEGNGKIIEQPKLLVPDIKFKTMNLKDEESQRQFLEQLRAAGIPISMKTRLVNVPIDLDEEIETSKEEAVKLAVAEQEARKEQFKALRNAGLPIDPMLRQDFGPQANNAPQQADLGRTPALGYDPLVDSPNLAPTQDDLAAYPPGEGAEVPGVPGAPVDPVALVGGDGSVIPLPQRGDDEDDGARPEESDEMRQGMPKPAALFKAASTMRKVAEAHYEPDPAPDPVYDEQGEEHEGRDDYPRGKFAAPKHIGMRRYLVEDGLMTPGQELTG